MTILSVNSAMKIKLTFLSCLLSFGREKCWDPIDIFDIIEFQNNTATVVVIIIIKKETQRPPQVLCNVHRLLVWRIQRASFIPESRHMADVFCLGCCPMAAYFEPEATQHCCEISPLTAVCVEMIYSIHSLVIAVSHTCHKNNYTPADEWWLSLCFCVSFGSE